MAGWAELEEQAPDIAAAGRELFFYPGFGFGYFATVRRDGGPRVHPVNPVIFGRSLGVFVVPSPKLADLRRDGRYALHSAGAENVNDEFYVTGSAREVPEGDRRAAAVAAYHGPVAADHVLFELDIERVMWARYATPPAWPPDYRHWTAGAPAAAE
jgi:hypothetical protein